jgi:phage tail protein X
MKTYVTLQGDMWDYIALKMYGDEKKKDLLMRANPKYRNIYIFSDGITLEIPDLDESVEDGTLPPWKQVQG